MNFNSSFCGNDLALLPRLQQHGMGTAARTSNFILWSTYKADIFFFLILIHIPFPMEERGAKVKLPEPPPAVRGCPGVPGLRQLDANTALRAELKSPTVSRNTWCVFKSAAELGENKHAEKAFSWTKGGEDSAGIFILL